MSESNVCIDLIEDDKTIIDKYAEVIMENPDLLFEKSDNVVDIIELIINEDLTMYKEGKITHAEYVNLIKTNYINTLSKAIKSNDDNVIKAILNELNNMVEYNVLTYEEYHKLLKPYKSNELIRNKINKKRKYVSSNDNDIQTVILSDLINNDTIISNDRIKAIENIFEKYISMYNKGILSHDEYMNLLKNNYNGIICYALKNNDNSVIELVLKEFRKLIKLEIISIEKYFVVLHHDDGAVLEYARSLNNDKIILDEYEYLYINDIISKDYYYKMAHPSYFKIFCYNIKSKFRKLFS